MWLHRFAMLTAVATLPLLVLGGLVTSTGAGLAVPDWPTTFGYHLFLFPWSKMVGGIFYEHSHRLVGAFVGLLTLVLALWLWITEPRRWLRWLGAVALVSVVAQGVVGGLRVVLLQHTLAIIHAGFAQAFFAVLCSIALLTSPEWKEPPRQTEAGDARRLQRVCVLTTGLIYLQSLFGAVLRHTGTRLDAHVLFGILVALHVGLLAFRILRKHADQPTLVRPMAILSGMLILQLGLGLGAYVGKFTALGAALAPLTLTALTTAHVITGALMLVACLVLTLRAYRLLTLMNPSLGRGLISDQVSA